MADAVSRNTAPIGTQVNCLDDMITPAVMSSYYSGGRESFTELEFKNKENVDLMK